jgi:very-short-patch-repair endonuclease
VDWETHGETAQQDAVRTAFLNGRGYKVLRFTNDEVMRHLEGALEGIRNACDSPSPNPLP